MRVDLEPSRRHWLDVDFVPSGVSLTLATDFGDRRSPLFEALLATLEPGGEHRFDPHTHRCVVVGRAPFTIRLSSLFVAIDPSAQTVEANGILSPYEARFLAETGAPHPGGLPPTPVRLKTDLHSHYAGCLGADRLLEIAMEDGIRYPAHLLSQVGVAIETSDTAVRELPPPAIRALREGLHVPLDRQVPFAEMQAIYRRRAPITKHLPSFAKQLESIADDYASMGVEYAELSLFDIVTADWLRIAQDCLPAIESRTGVRLRFLVGLHRNDDFEWDLDMLARIDRRRRSRYIVGVDFMGHETNPTRDFSPQLEAIAKWATTHRPGFVVRVHAGENPAFPDNVREAIDAAAGYDVELRIGHGLYGVDRDTVEALATRRIVVELNLDSNYALNNLQRCPRSPIGRYALAGVPLVIGTDGYGLYQTTLPLALETARLGGLSDDHLRAVVDVETALIERRLEAEAHLDVVIDIDDDAPLAHFTEVVANAKRQRREEHHRAFEARVAETNIPVLDESGLDEWFKGRRAISIAGAWRHSWERSSDADRQNITSMIREILEGVQRDAQVLVTGGTTHGVEGVVHRMASEFSVDVLGTIVESIPLDSIAEEGISRFFLAGRTFFDKAPRLYDLVARTDGVALFFGGGDVVNDEVQTAANLRLRRLMFGGAAGAARVHAGLDPARALHRAEDVFAALNRPSPALPFWHLGANEVVDIVALRAPGEVLLIQRSADAVCEALSWALPGGFRETDRPKGTLFVASEDARDAAVRELGEETGLDLSEHAEALRRIGSFEGDGRDPRDTPTAWSRTTLFAVIVPPELERRAVVGLDDASDARWYPLERTPRLAFDHERLLAAALAEPSIAAMVGALRK